MKFKTLFFASLVFCSSLVNAEWVVQQKSIKTFDKFAKTDEVELYTGDMVLHDFENLPKEGHKFVLVKIITQNQDTTIPPFDSMYFQLTTEQNTYSRTEDKFLLNYGIKPFTRLKIRKGTHEGELLFEVPITELTKTPTLFYKGEKVKCD